MRVAMLTAVVVVLAGCGQATGDGVAASPAPAAERNLVDEDYDGRFAVTGTVLQSPEHGPQLCSFIAESYPPQCGGPELVGWSWDETAFEEASGTRWTDSVSLAITLDGEKLTVLDQNFPPPARPDDDEPRGTPCEEPEQGWSPVDDALATDVALQQAQALIEQHPGLGSVWLDQRATPPDTGSNDPKRLVLNVSTTGDEAALQAELRQVWGGSLCVSSAARTRAELLQIQQQTLETSDFVTSNPSGDVLELTVQRGTAQRQQELDERFGEGVVELYGNYVPLD